MTLDELQNEYDAKMTELYNKVFHSDDYKLLDRIFFFALSRLRGKSYPYDDVDWFYKFVKELKSHNLLTDEQLSDLQDFEKGRSSAESWFVEWRNTVVDNPDLL